MKNLKAVVFDVGNVLIDFNPTKWLLENYEDMGSVKVLYEEVFSGEEWKSLDRGVITPEEAVKGVALRIPSYEKDVRRIFLHWESFLITKRNTSVKFLKLFKELGYKLYALSNYPERGFLNLSWLKPRDSWLVRSTEQN